MGCFSSRFDKRASAYTSDFNTVGLAFIGGDKDKAYDMFPADRCAWACNKEKEIAEACPVDGLAGKEDAITKAAITKAYDALKKKHEELNKKYGSKSDAKTIFVENRYASDSAVSQLAACVAFLEKAYPEDCKAAAPAPEAGAMMEANMMEGEMAAMDEMAEGGDGDMMADMGMDMAGMMEPPANPHKYDDDNDDQYNEVKNAPAGLLKQMIVNPLVGDIIKAEVMNWELKPDSAKVGDFTAIAGLIGTGVAGKQEGEAAFFLSGHLDENAFAALKDITEGENPSKAIHFPFLTYGWKTAEEAEQALNLMTPQKGDYKKVIFEVTGAKSMAFLGCRQVAHKVNGTIDAACNEASSTGVWNYKVTAVPMDHTKTIETWKADVAAAAEAAKAAADKKPEAMGEGMMEGEMMGDMMGEPMEMAAE